MNYRYLFRGKKAVVGENEFVIGCLLYTGDGRPTIITAPEFPIRKDTEFEGTADSWLVYPDTVGQCTGITDKNGTLIFEGDIFKNTVTGTVFFVKWDYGHFVRVNKERYFLALSTQSVGECEVIGNIHDTPELLDGSGA